MKIAKVETIHVKLPTRRVHKWTGLTEPIGGYVLVRVAGDGGEAGGPAPGHTGGGGRGGGRPALQRERLGGDDRVS